MTDLGDVSRAEADREGHTRQDPYRPVFHLAPPTGWMNDPNGLSQANGVYHFFYQHHPGSTEPGPMHWGHATSADLVRWKHEPVALTPGPHHYDRGGCWSGSAVVTEGGRLALFYTGCDRDLGQVQCAAFAEDASNVKYRKFEGNPVLVPPEGVSPKDFRDPKAWRHGDRWYMVVGSSLVGRLEERRGALQLYSSRDLRDWSHMGVAASASDAETEGRMWECPDLFPLDTVDSAVRPAPPCFGLPATGAEIGGACVVRPHRSQTSGHRHVMIFSPMLRYTLAVVGRMDYDAGRFTKDRTSVLDYGPDFYAPQTFQDEGGRRVLVGWMADWGTAKQSPTREHGWNGALTVPRELGLLDDGTLVQAPVSEIETLRGEHRALSDTTVTEGSRDPSEAVSGAVMDIDAEFDLAGTDACRFGLRLRRSAGGEEETLVCYDTKSQAVVLDRGRSGAGVPGGETAHEAPLPLAPDARLRLRVLLDRSSVEVFAGDARRSHPEAVRTGARVSDSYRVALTARVYPTREDSTRVGLFAVGGGARLVGLDAWRLG